jgi:cell shape-determining protein MreD
VRNTAFVAVGIAFLILQANIYRGLQLFGSLHDALVARLAAWDMPSAVALVKTISGAVATPNLVLPLLIFTGVHEYSLMRGTALAFVLGYALDVFAAAPVGLFTFVSVSTFVLARAAGVRLAAQTVLTQLALAFLFALANSVLVLVLLAIFGKNPYGARALAALILPHAISTALAAPLVFRIAQRIHLATLTVPRPGEGPPR